MDTYTHTWTHLYTYIVPNLYLSPLSWKLGMETRKNLLMTAVTQATAEPQFQWNGMSQFFCMADHLKHLQKVTIQPHKHSEQNAKHKTKQYSATNDGFALRPSKSLGTSVFDNFCNEILLHLANKMLYNCTCQLVCTLITELPSLYLISLPLKLKPYLD